LSYAQKSLGDKAWIPETVLRVAADLATFVNAFPNLSGQDKTHLVCQTILKMLDDVETAERGRLVESTVKAKTIARLEECRSAVALLPVSLELLVSASRGKIVLKKIVEGLNWSWSWNWPWSSWNGSFFSLCDPCGSVIQETTKAAELIAQHSTDCLEEMRVLVAKAEALVAKAEASAPVPSPAGVGLQSPPIPESAVPTLPGEAVTPSEVPVSQL
jgi:hypothetical protein